MQATQKNVDYFRQQASEAREMALRSINPAARENWLEIAKSWDKLAEEADRRTALRSKAPQH